MMGKMVTKTLYGVLLKANWKGLKKKMNKKVNKKMKRRTKLILIRMKLQSADRIIFFAKKLMMQGVSRRTKKKF